MSYIFPSSPPFYFSFSIITIQLCTIILNTFFQLKYQFFILSECNVFCSFQLCALSIWKHSGLIFYHFIILAIFLLVKIMQNFEGVKRISVIFLLHGQDRLPQEYMSNVLLLSYYLSSCIIPSCFVKDFC